MAMACLLLASKSEDIPKRLVDIIRECWRARHDERRDAVESSRPDDKVPTRTALQYVSLLRCTRELSNFAACSSVHIEGTIRVKVVLHNQCAINILLLAAQSCAEVDSLASA